MNQFSNSDRVCELYSNFKNWSRLVILTMLVLGSFSQEGYAACPCIDTNPNIGSMSVNGPIISNSSVSSCLNNIESSWLKTPDSSGQGGSPAPGSPWSTSTPMQYQVSQSGYYMLCWREPNGSGGYCYRENPPKWVSASSSCSTSLSCTPCTRDVSNTVHCTDGTHYQTFLNGTYGTGTTGSSWEECGNGTAHFYAQAYFNGDLVTFNLYFSGGTSSAPSGSPKSHKCNAGQSNMYYYTQTCGTIVSAANGTFNVYRRGPAMQRGNGANTTGSPAYGASGWFYLTGGNGHYKNGDINIQLASTCSDPCDASNFHPGSISGGASGCGSVNPGTTSTVAASGCHGGTIKYQWEIKTATGSGATWQPISGATSQNWDPPTYTSSVWVRRAAKCDPCGPWEYTNVVDYHVSKNYTSGGSLTADQCICPGSAASTITATAPTGGIVTWNGFLNSKWEIRSPGGSWSTLSSNTDSDPNTPDVPLTYNPGSLSNTKEYRRCSRIEPCKEWKCTNVIRITVDKDGPTANDPPNINVTCFSDIPAPDINVITGESDNCSKNNITVTHVSDNPATVSCDGADVTVDRTYRLTDHCGNQTHKVQKIIVSDNTAPTASNPAGDSFQCFDDIPAPNPSVVTDEDDNCDNAPTVTHLNDNKTSASCNDYANGGFTVVRTYRVTDCAGNTKNVTQTFTINDTTNPTASNPSPINVECWEDVPAPSSSVVTDESDNCTPNGDITVTHVSDSKTSASCADYANGGFSFTRTYRVKDCAGNSITVEQTINVNDTTDPSASNPSAINVECWEDVPAPSISVVDDESDNCDSPNQLTVTHVSDSKTSATCADYANGGFSFTRTYKIEDCAGNSTTVTQTINVDDTTSPTASNPAPITAQCYDEVPAPDISVVNDEADNCDSPNQLTVTHVGDSNPNPTCADYANGGFTITRTYRIEDCAGNTKDVTQTITVDDTTPPSGDDLSPVTVECWEDVPSPDPSLVATEADNCSGSGELTVVHLNDSKTSATCSDYANGGFSFTRTYEIEDCAGNTATVSQQINVNDTTDPNASNPSTVNVECWEDVPAPDPSVVTDESDNCDAPNDLTVTHQGDSKTRRLTLQLLMYSVGKM